MALFVLLRQGLSRESRACQASQPAWIRGPYLHFPHSGITGGHHAQQAFMYVLRTQSMVPTLVQQVLYWLSHLPSLHLSLKDKNTCFTGNRNHPRISYFLIVGTKCLTRSSHGRKGSNVAHNSIGWSPWWLGEQGRRGAGVTLSHQHETESSKQNQAVPVTHFLQKGSTSSRFQTAHECMGGIPFDPPHPSQKKPHTQVLIEVSIRSENRRDWVCSKDSPTLHDTVPPAL